MQGYFVEIRGEIITLISVTVCVRDGIDWIDDCLDSLVNQTYSPLEIILVDDGSTDGSREKVSRWGEHELVTAIAQTAQGLSAGRMAALNQSKGEWVAITDIDVRPEPDWIENLLKATEGEEAVAVTGRTVFGTGIDIVSKIRSVEIEAKYRSRPKNTTLANGPCSMFKRDKLLEIGGFDPSWYHAEDMEVSLKLIEAGGRIIYTPDAVVNHVPEQGLMRFFNKRKRDARAHVRIVRKYKTKSDFLGSSWLVLIFIPVYSSMIFGLIWLMTVAPPVKELYLHPGLMMVVPLMIWYVLALNSNLKNAITSNTIKSTWVIAGWSLALWQGIILGYLDALFRRNGH